MGRDVALYAVHDLKRYISIHAPHMGRDRGAGPDVWCRSNFNPRAPYGARLWRFTAFATAMRFQSTRPIWGATIPIDRVNVACADFNPRAPYGARRTILTFQWITCWDFNPRAPYGARLLSKKSVSQGQLFQSTRPIWGATRRTAPQGRFPQNFNPRAPYGARQQKCIKCIIYVLHFCNNRQPKHKSQQETSSVRTFF